MSENKSSTIADKVTDLSPKIEAQSEWVERLKSELGKAVIGQQHLMQRLLVALLADGHVLLEGLPGLAKTRTLKTLAQVISINFHRIQFTPDMLPADIVGTEIYNPQRAEFVVKKGPVFSNLVLADEINRAPAKVQSALLEAMEERQVTIGDETFKLPATFLVMATQNPIEQEGTYPLPEAQVDRFMLKVKVAYPSVAEERQILDLIADTLQPASVNAIITEPQILEARKLVEAIYIDPTVKDYIVSLTFATRTPEAYDLESLKPYIRNGVSPRATINLCKAAKAMAFIQGRAYVTPDDVKAVAQEVMAHRIMISYEAEAEGFTHEMLIAKILETVPVP